MAGRLTLHLATIKTRYSKGQAGDGHLNPECVDKVNGMDKQSELGIL